jgi:hypothetical protein
VAERRAHDDRDTLATTLLAHLCLNCLLSARLRREPTSVVVAAPVLTPTAGRTRRRCPGERSGRW